MWCAGIRAAGLYRPTFWKRRGTPSEIIPPIVKKVTKLRANIPAHGTRAAAFGARASVAAHAVFASWYEAASAPKPSALRASSLRRRRRKGNGR